MGLKINIFPETIIQFKCNILSILRNARYAAM